MRCNVPSCSRLSRVSSLEHEMKIHGVAQNVKTAYIFGDPSIRLSCQLGLPFDQYYLPEIPITFSSLYRLFRTFFDVENLRQILMLHLFFQEITSAESVVQVLRIRMAREQRNIKCCVCIIEE